MSIIKVRNLVHEFIKRDEDNNVESITAALDDVNFDVKEGQFIAILGHNGSGKSTLAKHINALLAPTEGTIWVNDLDTSVEENIIPVRKNAGMVFQNPDNQIIASVVEEDVAFGPENLGVESEKIHKRVDKSLASVGMEQYRKHSPNRLSGGQKQRVAIAGVIAMEPKCIVFDEPTAMLDPNGRKEVIETAHILNKKKGVTVILITHYMEEVVGADYVYVMEKGKLVMQGTPNDIFKDVDRLKSYRLDVPQITLLSDELRKKGIALSNPILKEKDLIRELLNLNSLSAGNFSKSENASLDRAINNIDMDKDEQISALKEGIVLDHVSYTYSQGTAYKVNALKDVSLKIPKGQFIGVIGHTGSGKSTLIQHLNGLLKATSGNIYFDGEDIYDKDYNLTSLRGKVGLVFQYPEYQLFEQTVFEDVCFGPKNLGLDRKTCELRAFEALRNVHFPEELFYNSPFELSGGQKRRAAIAGVLAMKPKVLVLDEPTAGLDPAGRDEILELIAGMHKNLGITVILVSHSMEDVAKYVDRIIVMDKGMVQFDGQPKYVFSNYRKLEEMGLAAPAVSYIMKDLAAGGLDVDINAIGVDEARDSILKALAGGKVLD